MFKYSIKIEGYEGRSLDNDNAFQVQVTTTFYLSL